MQKQPFGKSKYENWFWQESSMDAEIVMWKIPGSKVSNADKVPPIQILTDSRGEDVMLKLRDQADTTLTKRVRVTYSGTAWQYILSDVRS